MHHKHDTVCLPLDEVEVEDRNLYQLSCTIVNGVSWNFSYCYIGGVFTQLFIYQNCTGVMLFVQKSKCYLYCIEVEIHWVVYNYKVTYVHVGIIVLCRYTCTNGCCACRIGLKCSIHVTFTCNILSSSLIA